jgi:hypothetical protein
MSHNFLDNIINVNFEESESLLSDDDMNYNYEDTRQLLGLNRLTP